MNTEKKTLWNKLKQDIDAFFGVPAQAKNKIVFTAENAELDFYDLADDATPVVGDKARYDGKPAGDSNGGEYVMATGETYKFTGEELTEIVPKEEDQTNDEVENLKSENATLTTEVENLKNQISNLTTEKETLTGRITTAEEIITNLKNFAKTDEDEANEKRDGKTNDEPKEESRVSSAFKNLKNKK